jgi:hypothetical protein
VYYTAVRIFGREGLSEAKIATADDGALAEYNAAVAALEVAVAEAKANGALQ